MILTLLGRVKFPIMHRIASRAKFYDELHFSSTIPLEQVSSGHIPRPARKSPLSAALGACAAENKDRYGFWQGIAKILLVPTLLIFRRSAHVELTFLAFAVSVFSSKPTKFFLKEMSHVYAQAFENAQ